MAVAAVPHLTCLLDLKGFLPFEKEWPRDMVVDVAISWQFAITQRGVAKYTRFLTYAAMLWLYVFLAGEYGEIIWVGHGCFNTCFLLFPIWSSSHGSGMGSADTACLNALHCGLPLGNGFLQRH
jgi:hypothetical protein